MIFLVRRVKVYSESRPVAPLSQEEVAAVRDWKKLSSDPLHPLAKRLQKRWQKALKDGQKPIFLIVLMESMRPSESAYFLKQLGKADGKASLTPELDTLAENSLVFYKAFSSGSVTRGGQEASFCGQLSSRDTSMMRGGAVHAFPCLPDLVALKNGQGDTQGFSFWYHGGNPGFDNQKSFWKSRLTQELMSQEDFGPEVPKTDWGVGDASFLARVTERLKAFQDQRSEAYAVGMALTVSHHIPWSLPSDGSRLEGVSQGEKFHPSYVTARYADKALGDFVRSLKAQNLWQNSLIAFVSDHGNTLPPYHDLYGPEDVYAELKRESHIQMMMAGGLVEQALAEGGQTHLAWDLPVSQVDVPQLFAYLQEWSDFTAMGENPLSLQRQSPVLSQLEAALFAPMLPARFVPDDYQKPAKLEESDPRGKTLLYYRNYLNQSYQAGSGLP